MPATRRSSIPRPGVHRPRSLATALLLLLLITIPAGAIVAQSPDPSASPAPAGSPAASPGGDGPATSPAGSPTASATTPSTGDCVEPEASAPPLPPDALSMPEEMRIALFENVWT